MCGQTFLRFSISIPSLFESLKVTVIIVILKKNYEVIKFISFVSVAMYALCRRLTLVKIGLQLRQVTMNLGQGHRLRSASNAAFIQTLDPHSTVKSEREREREREREVSEIASSEWNAF
ncbi:hypothetical protein V9T40_002432 [Parthenolecanium corni]|uniref:Uncharacterized protein n=1 Tax=Parthenolecanium corni TaxID=536013 RepID=A0AAN9TKG6_9HEMI